MNNNINLKHKYTPKIKGKSSVGGEGFEPPKASANGFTVRPGSPTPASAQKYKRASNISLFSENCK